MKRFILIAALALAAAFSANAQYNTNYKELKQTYNFRQYTKSDVDPYHTGWSEFASFFLPGSSQIVMKETARGFIFMGASLICTTIAQDCIKEVAKQINVDSEGKVTFKDEKVAKNNFYVFLGAAVADLGVAIWSSIDAGRVAKVKNMYYQDLCGKRSAAELNIEPFLSYTPATMQNGIQPAAGLSMKLSF